jgi:tRNA pseudouridine55 synthase
VIDGIAVVDKPPGLTSHDVVAQIRRALGMRKVGHAGTLDPAATGVLVIGVGRGTRLLGFLAASRKTYDAVMRLGVSTQSDDAESPAVSSASPDMIAQVSDRDIAQAVADLTGAIEQVPSAVSAVKVAGRRAHDRVRAGEAVTLQPRRVHIFRFDVRRVTRTPDWIDLDVTVECSAGTYIRALARDLGARLGIGGHVRTLRRTASGSFDAPVALAEFIAAPQFMSLGHAARQVLPAVTVTDVQAVRHGRILAWSSEQPQGEVALFDGAGTLLAIAHTEGDQMRYRVVFTDGSKP